MEWESAGAWLVYAVVPAASLVVLLLLIQRRFARNALVRSEIMRLTPFFHPDHPVRAEWLKCDYRFSVRGEVFDGNCLVPLHVFLTSPEQVAIWMDSRLNMPVLFHEGQRLVGDEPIEHYLLTHRDSIRIRYRTRNPMHNMPLESDILPKKVVENKSTGT
ncbi:MAG: hypothetical protein NXI24_23965 [bacterium]|nr:hypothetical protein [bacterium]